MQCIKPIQASIGHDGKIVFRQKDAIPGLLPLKLPCSKCLACRLNKAREKAIRCIHEAQEHTDNMFLTLTYNEDKLESDKLIYKHFQDFMQTLRDSESHKPIGYMVTGEYGDKNKRPHWHALIFNYRPKDAKIYRRTELGHYIYKSDFLENVLWDKGFAEFGDITIDSAGYVSRYATKKLEHGYDGHDYEPIHKTSSKHAIGKSWIEKYYSTTLANGYVLLPNNQKTKIPRYYLDWAKKFQTDHYIRYVTQVLPRLQIEAEAKQTKEDNIYLQSLSEYKGNAKAPKTRPQIKMTILKQKFKRLMETKKL